MCGRYTLKSRAEVIAERFGGQPPPTLPERFNIAPSRHLQVEFPGPQVPDRGGRLLDPAEYDVARLSRLLRSFHPDEMTDCPVSTLVNNARADKAECVTPLKET